MANRPSFPGMNPYLEQPRLWPEVHTFLLVNIAKALNPKITPKYRAAIERRVYRDALLVGIPDTLVFEKTPLATVRSSAATMVASQPERVHVPMSAEVTERYLEIREVATQRVITVLEVLSPANKRPGEGRNQYLSKRQAVLNSATHLVEIDLLRAGEPMPIEGGRSADYRILVSRAPERPTAEHYPFDLQDEIPRFLLPLQPEDLEPLIDLSTLLDQTYEEAALDLSIDYQALPVPPLSETTQAWLSQIVNAEQG